jgi:hypothetical protein
MQNAMDRYIIHLHKEEKDGRWRKRGVYDKTQNPKMCGNEIDK